MPDPRHSTSAGVSDRVTEILCGRLHLPMDVLDDDMVEAGLIDSADFLQLFLCLEEEFGITIRAADLLLENFATRRAITRFVAASERGANET
jgi:acyl carrier protein